jgi:hypothetical protein
MEAIIEVISYSWAIRDPRPSNPLGGMTLNLNLLGCHLPDLPADQQRMPPTQTSS